MKKKTPRGVEPCDYNLSDFIKLNNQLVSCAELLKNHMVILTSQSIEWSNEGMTTTHLLSFYSGMNWFNVSSSNVTFSALRNDDDHRWYQSKILSYPFCRRTVEFKTIGQNAGMTL